MNFHTKSSFSCLVMLSWRLTVSQCCASILVPISGICFRGTQHHGHGNAPKSQIQHKRTLELSWAEDNVIKLEITVLDNLENKWRCAGKIIMWLHPHTQQWCHRCMLLKTLCKKPCVLSGSCGLLAYWGFDVNKEHEKYLGKVCESMDPSQMWFGPLPFALVCKSYIARAERPLQMLPAVRYLNQTWNQPQPWVGYSQALVKDGEFLHLPAERHWKCKPHHRYAVMVWMALGVAKTAWKALNSASGASKAVHRMFVSLQ